MARRKRIIKKKPKDSDPNISRFKQAREERISSGQSLTKEGGAKDIELALELNQEGEFTDSQAKQAVGRAIGANAITPAPTVETREPLVIGPGMAKRKTINNLKKLDQSVAEIKSIPTPEPPKTKEPSISDILAEDGESGGIQMPPSFKIQEQQVQSDIAQLERLRATANEANQAMISQMQSSLQKRLAEAQELNKQALEAQNMLGITSGQSRFAPSLQASVMSATERAGLQQLADIEQQGLLLISQAQIAANNDDYEKLNNILTKRENLLSKKMSVFEKLAEEQALQEKEMALMAEQSSRKSAIARIVSEGETNPVSIFNQLSSLGYQNLSIDEIKDFTDTIQDQKTIEPFTLSPGQRRFAMDPATGEVKEIGYNPKAVAVNAIRSTPSSIANLSPETIDSLPALNSLGSISFMLQENSREAATANIVGAIQRQDQDAIRRTLSNTTLEAVGANASSQVVGREQAINALVDLKRDINQYKKMGGSMGKLVGTQESLARKLGTTTDPKLASIATKIRLSIQAYRSAISGAAFTESEAAEYERLFPSVGNSVQLNNTLVDSLSEAFSSFNSSFWNTYLGDSPRNIAEDTMIQLLEAQASPEQLEELINQ